MHLIWKNNYMNYIVIRNRNCFLVFLFFFLEGRDFFGGWVGVPWGWGCLVYITTDRSGDDTSRSKKEVSSNVLIKVELILAR